MRTRAHLVAIGLLIATAASANAQASTEDSVAGSTRSPFFVRTDFDARSGPSGENPTGEVQFLGGGDFDFGGPVTCLNVRGNVATFNMQTIFGIISAEVTDNAAAGTPDIVSGPAGAQRNPSDCSPFGPNDGLVVDPVTSGDLVVVDAQPAAPVPTKRADCRRGGYLRFGFRSARQCRRFVFKSRLCKRFARRGHVLKFCPPRLPAR